ncbi:MAG: glycosyl hydrolase [Bryobacteraceae bacterium]|nr:MAG: glycosyl hydrolase [Bryobacteraceae bacterium]
MAGMKPTIRTTLLGALVLAGALSGQQIRTGEWVPMFNGKNLDGWKANENPEAWQVVIEDGQPAIKTTGYRSHLFWMVEQCEDCEFKADFKVMDGSNSGMYFRAAFEPGWPKGYEAQVNATHKDPVKTGSLYNFHKNFVSPTRPGEWGTQHIIVRGNHIVIKVNDQVITDYVDEKNTYTKGWLALQGHDPQSTTYYRNLYYRRLPKEERK